MNSVLEGPRMRSLRMRSPGAAEPAVLAEFRAALVAARYREEAVAGPLGRHRFLAGTEADAVGELDEPLAGLVELFTLGHRLPAARARAALRPVNLEQILETGLLTGDGEWVAPVYRVRPHAHLLLAGDGSRPDDPNIVSAFTGPSVKLARLMPRTRVRSMLDLGTGSGVLALLGAARCDAVTATDVNPRALAFARFNARLNGISNLELLEGSWFEPAGDRRFDLIVCNAPYVISPDQHLAYRDSGLPGTALLEKLTREAAEHLAPGGVALFLCCWPHASEEDWDRAPRAAAAGTGCDALILSSGTVDPFEYAVRWNSPPISFSHPNSLRETVGRWIGYYRTTGVGAITYGAVVLRRRASGTPWVTTLRAPGDVGENGSEQLAALLAGRDLLGELDDHALLARRFSLPDGIDISQRFQRREGCFVGRPAMIRLEAGLGLSAAVHPDALEVVFACDGRRTLSEVIDRVAERRGEGAEAARDLAVAAVRRLLEHGLLREA